MQQLQRWSENHQRRDSTKAAWSTRGSSDHRGWQRVCWEVGWQRGCEHSMLISRCTQGRQEPDNTETQIHLTYRCCAGAQVQSRGERAWETEEGKEDQRKGALIRRHWRQKGDHACSCSCCWHAQPSSPVQFTEFLVTLGLKETKNTPKNLI